MTSTTHLELASEEAQAAFNAALAEEFPESPVYAKQAASHSARAEVLRNIIASKPGAIPVPGMAGVAGLSSAPAAGTGDPRLDKIVAEALAAVHTKAQTSLAENIDTTAASTPKVSDAELSKLIAAQIASYGDRAAEAEFKAQLAASGLTLEDLNQCRSAPAAQTDTATDEEISELAKHIAES